MATRRRRRRRPRRWRRTRPGMLTRTRNQTRLLRMRAGRRRLLRRRPRPLLPLHLQPRLLLRPNRWVLFVKQNLRAWDLFPRPEMLLGPAGMRPDWRCGDADSIHGETRAAAHPGRGEWFGGESNEGSASSVSRSNWKSMKDIYIADLISLDEGKLFDGFFLVLAKQQRTTKSN